VSPEDTAAACGREIAPAFARLDPLTIKPFCAECDRPIDPRLAAINDGVIGWTMADGSQHLVGLCQRCIASLDAASHAATIQRLQAIRAKAFS
jgi:hypothetical protein